MESGLQSWARETSYIKVVAVKKLVVEPWAWPAGLPHRMHWFGRAFPSG